MQFKLLLVCALILAGFGLVALRAPAQIAPVVSQELYWYPNGPDTPVGIPCGTVTQASVVYWNIYVTTLGPFTFHVTDRVDTPSVPAIWTTRPEGQAALHVAGGKTHVLTHTQKLVEAGAWTFTAQVSASKTVCTITKP